MKKYICDTCARETECYIRPKFYNTEVPEDWININIKNYHNSNERSNDRRLIHGGGDLHFCSKECFVNHFFFTDEEKNDNQ